MFKTIELKPGLHSYVSIMLFICPLHTGHIKVQEQIANKGNVSLYRAKTLPYLLILAVSSELIMDWVIAPCWGIIYFD